MGIETASYRVPQADGGIMCNKRANRALLLLLPLIGSTVALFAEPIQSDSTVAEDSNVFVAQSLTSNSAQSDPMVGRHSISALSATQSRTGRVLLAAEFGDGTATSSDSSPARAMFPFLPAPAPQLQAVTSVERAAASEEEEAAIVVGKSLRAYTRAEERSLEATGTEPRTRAAFSSAISRAAAAGAMSYSNFDGPVGNSLSASRFTPTAPDRSFDPGFSQAADLISVIPGLRLESATISAGYSSNSLPRGFQSSNAGSFGNGLGADYDLGVSAALGYSHVGRHSMIRANYSPSHMQRSNIPEWSTTDHRVSLSTSYDLSPRWTFNATGRAGQTGQEQLWFNAPKLRNVSTASTDLVGLLNRLQAGEITDDEFASILTGSPVVDDPGGRVNDLDRVLSTGVTTGLSYAHSRRITLTFGGSASTFRLLNGTARDDQPNVLYLSSSRQANANIGVSYKMSSRTQISASQVSSLSNSSYARSISHSPTISINQRMSRNWNYQLGAGVGSIRFMETSLAGLPNETSSTWTANGSLNYTKEGHMVSLTANRYIGDQLGTGSLSTSAAGLNWAWQSHRSPWGGTAGLGFSRSNYGSNAILARRISSDLYNAGITRRMTPSTTLRSDYFYGLFDSPYAGLVTNSSLHRVQMSLVWRPAEQR
jgi:hypothetical protein